MNVFKKVASFGVIATAIAAAQVTHAQTIGTLLNTGMNLLNLVVPILITVILIYMAVAGVNFARAKEGPAKSDARHGLINGAIALAVIFSIFGIIRVLQSTVFGPNGAGPNNPTGQGLTTPKVLQ